jgi:hypothetical protein
MRNIHIRPSAGERAAGRASTEGRFAQPFLVALVLTTSLLGCHRWEPVDEYPLDRRSELPDPARLILADGSAVVLEEAQFEADSVIGLYNAGLVKLARTLPAQDVRSVEAKVVDTAKTGAAIVLAAFALLLAVTLLKGAVDWERYLGARP